ncbi:Tenascin-X [Trichinella zimbabwensis]|uniref:Tenascin-X n=1 Tax=Trichinella zimbabwensis TaxID=268475 RepID=A0A0V1HIZ8_9BILA|nr:Tenascin-X [Trichinella zimbabwensis]
MKTCDKHSDCPGQAICDDGKCVPAKPVGGECKTDSDCNESKKQACISGICMAKAVSDKKEEKCTNHYDCSGQRVCKNAKCVPAYSTSKTCSNPGGCPLEQKCAYGYCFEAYDPSNPSKPPPPSEPSSDKCTVNEDCPGSALCKNGQCKTAIMLGKIQCTTDIQCGKNDIPNYKICKTHSECEGNFLCLNYVCVPAFTWGVHCDKFQSCPPKHICKNGKCYFFLLTMICLLVFTASLLNLLQLAASAECNSNSDCGSQTLCYKNKCVPAMPVGGDCESDYDCNTSENHYCIYGVCMTYAYVSDDKPDYNQKCNNHYDCSGQRVCRKYKCVAAYATQKTCSYPGNCELEEKCMDGLCFKAYLPGDNNNNNKPSFPPPTPPIYVPQCKKHEQCPNNYLCKDGKCKYAVQVGNIRCSYDQQCGETDKHENENNNPACTKHTHCPGYELCLKKQCVPASTWGVYCDSFQSCPPGHICKNDCILSVTVGHFLHECFVGLAISTVTVVVKQCVLARSVWQPNLLDQIVKKIQSAKIQKPVFMEYVCLRQKTHPHQAKAALIITIVKVNKSVIRKNVFLLIRPALAAKIMAAAMYNKYAVSAYAGQLISHENLARHEINPLRRSQSKSLILIFITILNNY